MATTTLRQCLRNEGDNLLNNPSSFEHIFRHVRKILRRRCRELHIHIYYIDMYLQSGLTYTILTRQPKNARIPM